METNYQLQFDYTQLNEVMTVVKHYHCSILKQEQQLFCLLIIGIPNNRLQEVLSRLIELKGVEYKAIN